MSLPHYQQCAIITGASSGIGKATALAFAKAGINLVLVSRSLNKLDAVASAVRSLGAEATVVPLDLSQIESISKQMGSIAKEFAPIDILVNNAGMAYTNTLQETTLTDWQQVIDLNLTSVFQCVQGILPEMRKRKTGLIINIASIAAKTPFPEWGAYCVSKAALATYAKVLAAEERNNGIRVATVFPGAVSTPIWDTDTVNVELDRSMMLSAETVAASILQTALLPPEAVIEELTLMPSGGAL